ncbi:ABC transporter substrate-binding protein [Hydrogenophaga sp. BPS33]|uniref:ABC transporter substrate-binding protein n=1 Tax=Hydrogenophaga sp. BPS33 TaxID=2651974 RepID=UPI00131F9F88|nr:ABC transporter substrate-binding protein [Hydrogenophaga sp. BPS33]QHE88833.1 ABC transporter substrate-binding protein [Hydrogenophaga sp. BPS33]
MVLPMVAQAQTASAPPIKVGAIGPFSGPSSDFGLPMLNGMRLAVDEINRVGGYLGRHIELVVRDDKGNPDVGLQESQALMKDGVIATLGFCNTGVALKSIPVFQKAQSPLLVPCSAGTPVTAQYPAAESYVFRNAPRDAIQAPFVVNDILKRGWNRVAIFADTTGYGEAGMKDVLAALDQKGVKPAYVGRFPLGVKDLSSELAAAKAAGANVIFTYTVGPENATIANGRRAMNWDVPLVGGWPLSFPFFLTGAPQAAEGALMAQTFIAEPSNERRAAFISGYTRKFNQKMAVPMAAAQGYDTVYLLIYAMFGIRDGKFSGPAMKAALENIPRTYYGVVATYERPFTVDDKDAVTDNMLVMGKVQKGLITFAYPEDARRNLEVQRKR